MTNARHAANHRRACIALVLTVSTVAAADGEKTPMLGGAVIGGDSANAEHHAGVLGAELEAAWWRGRFGVALEGSLRRTADGAGTGATVLGGSARVRVLEYMLPSLLEPRDVELGIELQLIAERAWWNDAVADRDPSAYGLGIAVRLRGGGDEASSTLLAESRMFIRVLSSRWTVSDAVARTTAPSTDPPRELTVLVGIGASFGAGEPGYVDRFRWHALDPAARLGWR